MITTFQNEEFRKLRLSGWGVAGALFLILFIWSSVAKLSSAVIASGNLEVAGYKQIVQHEEGGIVDEIYVQNGARVEEGDILMSINSQDVRPEFEIFDRLYVESLAEKGRLIAERDDLDAPKFPTEITELMDQEPYVKEIMAEQTRIFNFRTESLHNELNLIDQQRLQLQRRIEGRTAERDAVNAQRELTSVELDRMSQLVKQHLANKAELTAIKSQDVQLQGQLASLDADIAELENQLSQIDIQRLKILEQPREEAVTRLRELEKREVEYFQRRNSLKTSLDRLQLTAPLTGRVYGLQVYKSGTVITPGQEIMYIVPDDDRLIVRGRVNASDITDISMDQDAELKFVAFNLRKTPYIGGKVTNISADAFTDRNTGVRYYEVEVLPEDGFEKKLGGEKITPGQPVELFLHTGQRTFLDYLLRPIADNFDKAFRE